MGKKLLVFCGGHLLGGQEIVTLNYLTELKKLGVEIYCITNAWSDGAFEKRLSDLQIPFESLKLGFIYPRKPIWTLDTLFHFPTALKKIKKIIAMFKPDAYYHTSFRTIYMLQFFLNTKHILHVHENIEHSFFNKHIIKTIAKHTKKVIAVSDSTKQSLVECGLCGHKIETLYNGTEIIPRTKHTKNKTSFRLGIVGQVASHKGHEVLISALGSLKGKNISFKLKIFGAGEEKYLDVLKKQIREIGLAKEVEWMGFQNSLNDIYGHIDILVMPSLVIESFGMVIIEAGTREVLILASDHGGPAEIIKHNQNGILFESGDSEDLAFKLGEIFLAKVPIKQLVDKNYTKISDEFDITMQAEKLKNLLFE